MTPPEVIPDLQTAQVKPSTGCDYILHVHIFVYINIAFAFYLKFEYLVGNIGGRVFQNLGTFFGAYFWHLKRNRVKGPWIAGAFISMLPKVRDALSHAFPFSLF